MDYMKAPAGILFAALSIALIGAFLANVSSASAAPPPFLTNYQLYDRSDDIRSLQELLNANGFVVAQTGPGSLGNETSIFGLHTYQALKHFQSARGLPSTGFFGPLTRASINASIGSSSSLASASTTGSSAATSTAPSFGALLPGYAPGQLIFGGGGPPPPTCTISASPANISIGSSTLLTWISANASTASINQSIGSVSLSGSQSVSPTTNSTYILTVANSEGSTASCGANASATETTSPSVVLTVPSAGATIGGNSITLTATSSDIVGVAGVQFKVDGVNIGPSGTTSPYSISWNSTSVTDGSRTIAAVAYNAVGNYATSSIMVSVRNNPPVISSISSGTPTTTSATITWTTDEAATSQVEYGTTSSYGATTSLDSTLTTSHVVTLNGLSAGTTYHYAVVSTDSVGNTATSSDHAFHTFSPNDIGGLQLWLSGDSGVFSDAGVTPATNGAKVQQWNDRSGNGNNCTEATSSNQATFNTGQVNNLPALTFNGSSTYCSHPYLGDIGTVFIVYKMTSKSSNQGLMGANSSVALGAYLIKANSGQKQTFIRATTNDTTGASYSVSSNHVLNTWTTFGVTNTGNSGAISLYKMGVQAGASVSAPATLRPVASAAIIGAEYYNFSPTDFFGGSIAEVIVYSTALSTNDYQRVTEYLTAKYGLGYSGQFLYASEQGPSDYDTNLYITQGNDGQHWAYRPSSYLPNGSDTVTCPSLLFYNNTFYLVHTSTGAAFGNITADIATAPNDGKFNFTYAEQISWSDVVSGGNAAMYCPQWATDTDGSIHLLAAASNTANAGTSFQLYEKHPTTPTNPSGAWSSSTLITGTSLPTNMIDPSLNILSGTRNIWFKDAATSYIGYLSCGTTANVWSGCTVTQSGNWAGWGTPLEAPYVFNLPNSGPAEILLDGNPQSIGMQFSQSTNSWISWSAKAAITAPFTIQHGNVIGSPSGY